MKGSIYDMLDAIEETLADANVEASTHVSASDDEWSDDEWVECSDCNYEYNKEIKYL